MGVYLLNISRQPEKPHHATSLEAGLMSEFEYRIRHRQSGHGLGSSSLAQTPG
jgi:hypothetical protein